MQRCSASLTGYMCFQHTQSTFKYKPRQTDSTGFEAAGAGSHGGQVDARLQRCVPDSTNLLPNAFIARVRSVEGPQAADGAWSPLLQKRGRPTEKGGQDLGLMLCQACRPQAVLSAPHRKQPWCATSESSAMSGRDARRCLLAQKNTQQHCQAVPMPGEARCTDNSAAPPTALTAG